MQPQIPGNTGTIGRTAQATGSSLHLVHPLGFQTDEKALRRAGLDYWSKLDVKEHANWAAFLERELSIAASSRGAQAWLFTTKARASQLHWQANFKQGDFLIFGSETAGAPQEVHDYVCEAHGASHRVALPMLDDARSINLSSAVCAGVYEALRQVSQQQDTE